MLTFASCCGCRVLPDVLLVDVAGEEVRCRDGHDGGRDERADRDRSEGDAGEPVREHLVVEQRHDRVPIAGDPGLGVGADRRDAGGDRHVAEEGQQPEHHAVGRQGSHVALDHVAAATCQDAGDRVRVDEQRQGRAEREGRVADDLRVGKEQPVRRALRRWRCAVELLVGGAEDRIPAAELAGDVDDRRDDNDVDQRVLDERDQCWCPQAGLVCVDGQDQEGDDQRQVAGETLPLDAHGLEDGLDPHELQGDVGHRRHDAGERDHESKDRRAVPAADEVGGRHVPVAVADRPEPDSHEEDHRVDHDGVRHREEAEGSRAIDERGHGDERVRGVEVAADQEPGDPGAEVAAAEPPLVEVLQRLGPTPTRRDEAQDRDEPEEQAEDDQLSGLDVVHHRSPRVAR